MTPTLTKNAVKVLPQIHKIPFKPFQNKLRVSVSEGVYLIDFEDIYRIQACGNYSTIHYKGGVITASKSLKHFEDQLPSSQFIRIHSSHLVSMTQIEFISKTGLSLKDGSQCPISRRSKAYLNKLVHS